MASHQEGYGFGSGSAVDLQHFRCTLGLSLDCKTKLVSQMPLENEDGRQRLLSDTILLLICPRILYTMIPVLGESHQGNLDQRSFTLSSASAKLRPHGDCNVQRPSELGGPSDRTRPCLQGGRKQLRGSFLHVFISSAQLLISVV